MPAYTKTKRGKRGGQMSKNVSSADARTPEQYQRAVRREEYIEASIWVKVNNDADPDPCFLQTWLQAVRKRIAHVKAMREQAASVQDSHDDEPVPDISEPATCSECSDDESDAELVLKFEDRMTMNLNRHVPGFEVFKSSVKNESEQAYKLDRASTWETKYVVLPRLCWSRTQLNRLTRTSPGFVPLVQRCALLCYRMVYVDDKRLLDHDEVMQLIASTLHAYPVRPEFLLLKEYVVWVARCCCGSEVCGFGKEFPVLWPLIDLLGMPLCDDPERKAELMKEDKAEMLRAALSVVEVMKQPFADALSPMGSLMASISEDLAHRDRSVPLVDLTVDSEPATKRLQGATREQAVQKKIVRGSVRSYLPPQHEPLVIRNFLQPSITWPGLKRGELIIMSCYKSDSNLFQHFVTTQFEFAACQPQPVIVKPGMKTSTKKTGAILCDAFHFSRKNGAGPDTYLSVKDARYDMQDYNSRWHRKEKIRTLWKHHVATAPTVILYPSNSLTIVYLVKNPYRWIHSLCLSPDKYEMYPKGCDADNPGKGTRAVGKWDWLMEPVYIHHPGDCMIIYGTRIHFGNAIQFWCEHVQGFLSGNVTIDRKTQDIFFLRAEDLEGQTNKVSEQLLSAGIPPKPSVIEPTLETRHVGPSGVAESTHVSKSLDKVRHAIPPHIMAKINAELHKYPHIMPYLEYDYMEPSQAEIWQSDKVKEAADIAGEALDNLRTGAVGIWTEEVYHADGSVWT